MSKISTIHDAYVTYLNANLTGYTRIPDPYDIEGNAKLLLQKGFGVGMGPSVNTNRVVKPILSQARQFFVVLVNQINTTENDTAGRATAAKAIMEDAWTLINAFEADDTLGGNATNTKYVSDTGINYLPGKGARYFTVELTFETEYFETIT